VPILWVSGAGYNNGWEVKVADEITWKEMVMGTLTACSGLVYVVYRNLIGRFVATKEGVESLRKITDNHAARLSVVETTLHERTDRILSKLEEMDSGSKEWRTIFSQRINSIEERINNKEKD
jgi:anion-transporting  ArsA/GET3 family ATPase